MVTQAIQLVKILSRFCRMVESMEGPFWDRIWKFGVCRVVVTLLAVLVLTNSATAHSVASDVAYIVAAIEAAHDHSPNGKVDGHSGLHAEHSHESVPLRTSTRLFEVSLPSYGVMSVLPLSANVPVLPYRPPTALMW